MKNFLLAMILSLTMMIGFGNLAKGQAPCCNLPACNNDTAFTVCNHLHCGVWLHWGTQCCGEVEFFLDSMACAGSGGCLTSDMCPGTCISTWTSFPSGNPNPFAPHGAGIYEWDFPSINICGPPSNDCMTGVKVIWDGGTRTFTISCI